MKANRVVRVVQMLGLLSVWTILGSARASSAPLVAVHGTIVSVTAKSERLLVRTDATATMPTMTMPFIWFRRPAGLRIGDVFDGRADTRTEPWTLRAGTVRPRVAFAPRDAYVPMLQIGDVVPDFALRDQRDRPVALADRSHPATILAFVYTRCRDGTMCPLVSAKFAAMQRLLAATRIRLIEATLDPAYDRPSVLRRYGALFGADAARWSLVTGDVRPMHRLAERFGVFTEGDPAIALRHSAGVAILTSGGTLADRIDDVAWTPEQVVALARSRASLSSDPVARFRFALGRGVAAVCGVGTSGISLGAALLLFTAILTAIALVARRAFRDARPPR